MSVSEHHTASEEARHLGAELEAKLMRQIASEWDALNWQLFGQVLSAPVFELADAHFRIGEWKAQERVIALSRSFVLSRPWAETLEVLKHEMAHQFVSEVLGGEPKPHGPKFKMVCAARGIDASTRHLAGAPTSDDDQDRIIARVRKLLALAESSNRHEAEVAAATAQRWMTRLNVDLERDGQADPEGCRAMWLGEPTGKLQLFHRKLANILIRYFFVEGIWLPVYRPWEGKKGTVLEICGRPENLRMAEFVHSFLLRTIDRLWVEHKRAHGITSNQQRRSFLAGALVGFESKLAAQRRSAEEEGLIWVGGAAREYLERRHPRRSSSRRTSKTLRAGFEAGRQAGRDIVLSRPMEGGASSSGAPRALPAAKRRSSW